MRHSNLLKNSFNRRSLLTILCLKPEWRIKISLLLTRKDKSVSKGRDNKLLDVGAHKDTEPIFLHHADHAQRLRDEGTSMARPITVAVALSIWNCIGTTKD